MKVDVTTHLKSQADAIRRGAEILVDSVNDWQVIKEYLSNRAKDLELTDTQQKKLERYNFMYNLLASGKYIEHETVNVCAEVHKVSIQQSYEDLACTKELFSVIFNFNKAFELRLQLDLNREMLNRATESKDFVAYGILEKNRVKLISMLPEQQQEENWFEPHENIIEFNPELIGAEEVDMKQVLAYINEKRKIKIKTELFDEAETVNDGSSTPALQ